MPSRRSLAASRGWKTRRARQQADAFQREPASAQDATLPPRLYESVGDVMRGMMHFLRGVLVNSDVAFRRDRSLQRLMRHDPDVMAPLLQRQLAVALLDYDIVPEDEENKGQLKQAEELKDILGCVRRWPDFIRQLQEAVWYGPSAVSPIYERTKDRVEVREWLPLHPDTLIFDEFGNLGLRVSFRYQEHHPGADVFPSWDGLAHMLTPQEREATILHVFEPQGPDYDEWFQGRYHWSGRGLRDVVWYQWLMKQKALQLWMTFIERYAMGIRVGRYPDGNTRAKAEMAKNLRNLLGDVSVLLPDDRMTTGSGLPESQYGIEVLDPPGRGQGSKTYADLIEGYLAGQIKELIIGQTATTEATTSGLGSNVATQHAVTFNRLIEADAQALGDTLTRELVRPLARMNFGEEAQDLFRLEFAMKQVDSEKWMTGVKDYVGIGGVVSQRQVRQELGLEEPADDEDTLGGMQEGLFNFGGGATMPGMNGQGGGNGEGIRRALAGNGQAR